MGAATWAADGPEISSPAPAPGERTDAFLAELGFFGEEVEALREQRVV